MDRKDRGTMNDISARGMVGLVLAGGYSLRFGSDKALAPCPEAGEGARGFPGEIAGGVAGHAVSAGAASPAAPSHLLRAVDILRSVPGLECVAVSCRRDQADAFRGVLPPDVPLRMVRSESLTFSWENGTSFFTVMP